MARIHWPEAARHQAGDATRTDTRTRGPATRNPGPSWRPLGWSAGLGLLLSGMIACATTAPALTPEQAQAQASIREGLTAYSNDDPLTAMAAFEEAVGLDPKAVEGWIGLGASRASAGKDRLALEAFQEATRQAPTNARAWLGVGAAYSGMGENASAITAFERAVKLDPKNAHAQLGLGIAYMEAGQKDKALAQVAILEGLDAGTLASELRSLVTVPP